MDLDRTALNTQSENMFGKCVTSLNGQKQGL